ncbi:MAG: phospho-sugar mutase [Lachnospiraceae bacterium]|nr:phospho-sugar mutase [Lachnospiraceae bacterium]
MDAYEKAKEVYEQWLANPLFDAETHEELLSIADNKDEILDRFYMDLEFGTAGLRGIIGAGTNRMNKYVVRKATQGLANYILKQGTQDMGVAIAYDCRRMSPEFSMEAALCLAANGIKVYLFDELRPTPELSFAIRYLGCTSAINVTASHNPPEYNGYKAYWADGAQVTPPHDEGIMAEVNAITDYADAKTMDEQAARDAGLLITIGKEVDDAFIAACKAQIREPEAIAKEAKDLKIVYTPLNGAGNKTLRRILAELGFEQVYVVKEQEAADGNFPTVSYPNPEDPKAFELALKLAKEVDADIVLATDPDSDRIGMFAKGDDGYIRFNGNMTGCLLADYELGRLAAQGKLPKDGAVISTVVSSRFIQSIAKYYGVDFYATLTGFKYIGAQIKEFDDNNSGTFIFGYEESFGYLIGDHARDKDAIVAGMALCEAAAYYKSQGKSLWQAMIDLCERMGYYQEGSRSITLKGLDGKAKIKAIMAGLRANPPKEIDGMPILEIADFSTQTAVDLVTGETKALTQPKSNVLTYKLADDFWCAVRPSGTEPKIKIYDGAKGGSFPDAAEKEAALAEAMLKIVEEAGE